MGSLSLDFGYQIIYIGINITNTHPQSILQVLIRKPSSCFRFIKIHHGKKLFTFICASKYANNFPGKCPHQWIFLFWQIDFIELNELHVFKLRLQTNVFLELNQLHLQVFWCVGYVTLRWSSEQTETALYISEVTKSGWELIRQRFQLISVLVVTNIFVPGQSWKMETVFRSHLCFP